MLGNKLTDADLTLGNDALAAALFVKLLFSVDSVDDLAKNAVLTFFFNTCFGKVVAQDCLGVNGTVGEYLDFLICLFAGEVYFIYTVEFDVVCCLEVKNCSCFVEEFAGDGRNYVTGESLADDALGDSELLVEFVASYGSKVVSLGIEEEVVDEKLSGLNERRLAGTELLVDLFESFIACRCAILVGLHGHGVLFDGGKDLGVVAEKGLDLGIGFNAESADEDGYRNLAVLVDTDPEHVGRVCFAFEPCSAIGNNGRAVELLTGLVHVRFVVYAGGTCDLRNDNALRTVDNEGAVVGHEREIAHEDLAVDNFACLLVEQTNGYAKGCGIVYVALLAFLNRILGGGVDGIANELDVKVARVVGDRRNVAKHLHKSFVKEPLVGFFLNLNEVRHVESFVDLRKAHSCAFADLVWLRHCHLDNHSIL